MPHLKPGTKVRIKNYDYDLNGLYGVVMSRDGEYYSLNMGNGFTVHGIYLCEMEVVKNA